MKSFPGDKLIFVYSEKGNCGLYTLAVIHIGSIEKNLYIGYLSFLYYLPIRNVFRAIKTKYSALNPIHEGTSERCRMVPPYFYSFCLFGRYYRLSKNLFKFLVCVFT